MSQSCRWSRFFVFIVLLVTSIVRASMADPEPLNWSTIPQSQLPEMLTAAVWRLRHELAEGKVLVVPVNAHLNRSAGGWGFENHATETLTQVLSICGFDAVVCGQHHTTLRDQGKTLSQRIRMLLGEYDASLLILCEYSPSIGECKGYIALDAYGKTGGLIPMGHITMGVSKSDDDYFSCTPPQNRRIADWSREQLGKKVRRGECWDLPAEAMLKNGCWKGIPPNPYDFGRRLASTEGAFPGDVVVKSPLKHCVVVYKPAGRGSYHVLHTNWMWGKEEGRRVAWARLSELSKHTVYRVHSSPEDRKAFSSRVADAKRLSPSDFPVEPKKAKSVGRPSRSLVSKETIAVFDGKLTEKLVRLSDEGRLASTAFLLPALEGKYLVQRIDGSGSMQILSTARLQETRPKFVQLSHLPLLDRACIARTVAQLEPSNTGAQAFVALYLIAAGRADKAQEYVVRAGGDGEKLLKLLEKDLRK